MAIVLKRAIELLAPPIFKLCDKNIYYHSESANIYTKLTLPFEVIHLISNIIMMMMNTTALFRVK